MCFQNTPKQPPSQSNIFNILPSPPQSPSNFLKFHLFVTEPPQVSKAFPQASIDSSKFCVTPMVKPLPYQNFLIQIPSSGVLKVMRLGQYTILGTYKLQQSNRKLIIQHSVMNQNKIHNFYAG